MSFSDSVTSYSKFKTRIQDLKALQESLREQIKVYATNDLPKQEETEKFQKLNEIASSIV